MYVEGAGETGELVASAADTIARTSADADLVTGRQLCSDLAVLVANRDNAEPVLDPQVRAVLRSMESLCKAWMPITYSAVVHCRDHYDQEAGGDQFRGKVLDLQSATEAAVYEAIRATNVPIFDLPQGLTTQARVEWIAKHLHLLGINAH